MKLRKFFRKEDDMKNKKEFEYGKTKVIEDLLSGTYKTPISDPLESLKMDKNHKKYGRVKTKNR